MDIHEKNLLAPKGVVGLLAVRGEATFHWSMMHIREASIEVSCHFSLDELRILIHFLQQGLIKIAPMITHHTSIDRAPSVYAALRDQPKDLLGVVFDW